LTALAVKYRDVRVLVPFVTQFGLYITPVGFSSGYIREKLGEKFFLLYSLNPMVGVIDGFRWCLLRGANPILPSGFLISMISTMFILWMGLRYFRTVERSFADII